MSGPAWDVFAQDGLVRLDFEDDGLNFGYATRITLDPDKARILAKDLVASAERAEEDEDD